MKTIPRVRERSVKKFPSVTGTDDTSICLGQNGALRSRGDRELQISKAKIPDFERYEKMSLWDHFCSILRLFDQTPYFRVKRFLQTVFGIDLEGSYFVQRNRNIAAAAPLSGLVPNSKSGIWAILKNGRGIFFENPKPICTDRSSWIYFSRLLVQRSTIPTCKGSAFTRCNIELESGEILTTACWHSLYTI